MKTHIAFSPQEFAETCKIASSGDTIACADSAIEERALKHLVPKGVVVKWGTPEQPEPMKTHTPPVYTGLEYDGEKLVWTMADHADPVLYVNGEPVAWLAGVVRI